MAAARTTIHICSTWLRSLQPSTSTPWSCSYRTRFDAYQRLANSCSFLFLFFFFPLKTVTISEDTLQRNYMPRTQGNRQHKKAHSWSKKTQFSAFLPHLNRSKMRQGSELSPAPLLSWTIKQLCILMLHWEADTLFDFAPTCYSNGTKSIQTTKKVLPHLSAEGGKDLRDSKSSFLLRFCNSLEHFFTYPFHLCARFIHSIAKH